MTTGDGRAALLAAALFIAGCAASPEPADDDSLYRALGEREGIERIVDGLLFRISEDGRIVEQFRGIDVARFERLLSEQLCELSGGPCTYSGDDMVTAHRGQDISEAEFNALVENLIEVMEHQNVPVAAQNRLVAKLAPMREDIIHQ